MDTKSDIQELATCLHQVVKTSLFIHSAIADSIQISSKSSTELSSLVNYLVNRIFASLAPKEYRLIIHTNFISNNTMN